MNKILIMAYKAKPISVLSRKDTPKPNDPERVTVRVWAKRQIKTTIGVLGLISAR